MRCGGTPGKPASIREMTWTEDPPVWVGYCKGCADCDPTGSHRKSVEAKRVEAEEARLMQEINELRRQLHNLRVGKAQSTEGK